MIVEWDGREDDLFDEFEWEVREWRVDRK